MGDQYAGVYGLDDDNLRMTPQGTGYIAPPATSGLPQLSGGAGAAGATHPHDTRGMMGTKHADQPAQRPLSPKELLDWANKQLDQTKVQTAAIDSQSPAVHSVDMDANGQQLPTWLVQAVAKDPIR